MTTKPSLAPEIDAAYKKLMDTAAKLRAAASDLAGALVAAKDAGADLRQSDIDVVTTRFMQQIPDGLERRAGALLPPVSANMSADLTALMVKAGSE